MFLCTIFIWPCDFDLRPFDLGGVSCINIHTSKAHTHYEHHTIIRSWVMGDSIWSNYHHMERSPRFAVSRDLSPGGNDPHFWNTLCHFKGETTNIKPCYRRKIAFVPLWRLQSSQRMRSITWLVPKPHVTIFDSELSIHYTTFMGLRWRLRVVLYWSIPTLRRFSAAKSCQNRSQKLWFFGNLRVWILNIVIATPTRHFLTRNDVLWRIFRKNPFNAVGSVRISPRTSLHRAITHLVQRLQLKIFHIVEKLWNLAHFEVTL